MLLMAWESCRETATSEAGLLRGRVQLQRGVTSGDLSIVRGRRGTLLAKAPATVLVLVQLGTLVGDWLAVVGSVLVGGLGLESEVNPSQVGRGENGRGIGTEQK
jgi:hypothetical protein